MSWANLDDQFPFHPKVVAAGNAAVGAFCRLVAWSKAQGTDGKIPLGVARVMASEDEIVSLVNAHGPSGKGLLEEDGRDYLIHDFLDWNDSTDAVAKLRRKRQKAGSRGGSKSASKRQASAQANDKQVGSKGVGVGDGLEIRDPEGEPEREPVPPEGPSEVREVDREGEYREAYVRGVAEGKRGPYGWPGGLHDQGALNQAVLAHARRPDGQAHRGPKVLEWVQAAAADFAEAVTKSGETKFYAGLAPKGFLRWLNEQVQADEARHVR